MSATASTSDAALRDLAADTAVTKLRVAPGWYTANVPPHWNFRTPSGGVLMTVAMRAMAEELGDPQLRPISANTHFCSPVPAGPLEVRVEVFNIFNRANFGVPNLIAFAGAADNEPVVGNFGRIRNTVTSARQLQLGVRYRF